ncbi:1-phosphofructokinase [Bacillus horti]|uniref:Tagatose-6-phosphate kinase n=1 Tax=Caldalkalibacillus horti TaxID=77523 RepID=A0ABT9W341_9BACI|nr:1-phosphofructokinase [Bacillus horti]MDQ0167656.1 1-phosphofructokinase [Bacillus horti]
MIYTCTLNPSIDYVMELDEVKLGQLNRSEKVAFYPGGKGINVSRVLKRLGSESVALGYLGGFTGEYIRQFLDQEGIMNRCIELEGTTRINIKLKANQETEMNGTGPQIPESEQFKLLSQVGELTEKDILVLAGSLPTSVPKDFYSKLAEHCLKHNIPFVLDTSGIALADTLRYRPFLIKPNQHELGELVGVPIKTLEDAAKYGKEVLQRGPEYVLVSIGGLGAVLVGKEITAFASVPQGEVINSVGAGDSMVAGFLSVFAKDGNILEAFRQGVAAGSATAFSQDLCTVEKVQELLPYVEVQVKE